MGRLRRECRTGALACRRWHRRSTSRSTWPVSTGGRRRSTRRCRCTRRTFVVVDLETTGGAPDGGGITEIGAVKVRGGEQLGVFATLVNPGAADPAVHHRADRHHPGDAGAGAADRAGAAELPGVPRATRCWWPTTRPYDVGFLKAACARHGYRWPNPRVLDTAALARRVLTRDEVPNRKLGTLAAYFRTATQPTHRALDDARATVDVLHGLIGRLGGHRVLHARRRHRVRQGGHPDPAPQAAPGRGAARRARGLHLPGRRRPAALRGHLQRHRHPGAQLLHRRREARPDLRDARRRRAGRGGGVRPLAGGGGPRAAADRRARAAVQPPVEVSRSGWSG